MFKEYSDDQEVVRTVGELKKCASKNWWVGFGSGMAMLIGVIVLLISVGLYYNI